jgi:hypothetical protein
LSARCRAFCALLPWIALGGDAVLLEALDHPVGAALGAREDDARASTSRSADESRRGARACRPCVDDTSTRLHDLRDRHAPGGVTSTRTGFAEEPVSRVARPRPASWRRRAPTAPARMEPRDDRLHRLDEADDRASGRPRRARRSAVSSKTDRHPRASGRSAGPGSRRGCRRPSRAGAPGPLRDMPPSTRHVASFARPRRMTAKRRLDLHGELARRREDQRPRTSSAPAGPSAPASALSIGRPKAAVLPVPVWAMPRMSRPSICGRDRLRLDRRRRGEAGAREPGEKRIGKAEAGEGRFSHIFPFRDRALPGAAVALVRRCDENPMKRCGDRTILLAPP